jgi:MSHA biogenesis protein MshP
MSQRRAQRGMSLVAALFVVVVLGALATFAVRIGAAGQQDADTALMSERALAAADAGFEFAAYRALSVPPPTPCAARPTIAAPVTINLTQSSLSGFTATVSWGCQDHALNPGGPYQTFRISVLAQRGTYGTAGYVAQRLTKNLTNAP